MGFNFGVTYSERYLFWQRGTPAVCRGVVVEGRRGNCVLTTLYIVTIARCPLFQAAVKYSLTRIVAPLGNDENSHRELTSVSENTA